MRVRLADCRTVCSRAVAVRGMGRLLNQSTKLVGALVEWDKSTACCAELIAPSGAFALMHQRHGLCAHAGTALHPFESLEAICQLKRKRDNVQLNLRWCPCSA
jgi:hypothetical protein